MSEAAPGDPTARALLEEQRWPAETRWASLEGVREEMLLTAITAPTG